LNAYLGFERALVVKSDPLVVSVGEWHLLLVVPDKGGVVLVQEVAHFVVGHETGLGGVLARAATTGGRSADVKLGAVDQSERATVGGHTDHELLLRGSLLHPLACTVILQNEIVKNHEIIQKDKKTHILLNIRKRENGSKYIE
jgi:hypothetical protein